MKRQLNKRRRERDNEDPVMLSLIDCISNQQAGSDRPTVNASAVVKQFLHPFTENGKIDGEKINELCSMVKCSPRDLLRLCKTAPRSVSTEGCIDEAELCFAVAKSLSPVEVQDRRRAACIGDVTEQSSELIQLYKRIFPWTSNEEWESFLKCLSSPLPMTFRLHRSEKALSRMAEYAVSRSPLKHLVKPVAIFPGSGNPHDTSLCMFGCSHEAYHADADGELWARTLHSASAISFQEVVSAIPVAVLQPRPGMKVLDMCAAPGSKSLQALDSICQCDWISLRDSAVILNEKDRIKATQTLPARLKRYHAPNIIITRCDGTQLPRIYAKDETLDEVLFDRIICDVPCSGDGTIRKEKSVLTSWSPHYVESLVTTQKALLKRAIDLLSVGGIVVYSTCSMNPAEDEQVVANALEVYGDCCELLDVEEILRTQQHIVDLKSHGGVETPGLDATKVLRVLPHRNDTGGFFVAAIKKRSMSTMTKPMVSLAKLNNWTNHRRWITVPKGDEHWRTIMKFFGVDAASEEALLSHLRPLFNVNPNGGPQRRIIFVTPKVESILFGSAPFKGPGVELVSVGVRAFEAYDGKYLEDAPCRWRAVTECASRIATFATLRKLVVDVEKNASIVYRLFRYGSFEFDKDGATKVFCDASWWIPDTELLLPGCVLLGISGGPPGLSDESIWWLSATLNRNRLDLAVDESLKNFALLTLFNETLKPAEEGKLHCESTADVE